MSVNYTPVIDAAGKVTSIAVLIYDITECKAAEEEKLKMETHLPSLQKLESLGGMAGGIAHDFNNLLTAIMGNTDLALMALPPESPVREQQPASSTPFFPPNSPAAGWAWRQCWALFAPTTARSWWTAHRDRAPPSPFPCR